MSDLKDRVKQAASGVDEQPEQAPVTDLAVTDTARQWLQRRETYFTDALPRHVDRAHFMAVALAAMEKLKGCSPASLHTALLACCRFGLEPDGRQAAIVPYKGVATFQPMYEGYIELMYRHSRVDSVHFSWVRENDQWDYEPTAPSPRDFFHKPRVDLTDDERGPVILAYAFAWIDGRRSQVIILNRSQAEQIRNKYSKAYAKAEREKMYDSPWHTDFDAMWAKSAVRRLVKVVPTSHDITELLQADDDADDGQTTPPVIRGTVISRDDRPGTEGQETQATAWPTTAQPGGAAEGGEQE
ncbi:recombinase RecT [Streptomyces cinnabarinus]|uniref:Recombinase RecT n=1 Tax=Streptomyces cinnabarinus TaxID=67287 RepID=A0ABY7KBC1_9ACTN|nr:recombinase RecT [Streptomyces cinnabarinus]WAZ20239.1 recombinase RecT [Streptomyces cinnabarinus]